MTTQDISISGKNFPIVQFDGKPVITLAMVDQMHGRKAGTASDNFKNNRTRFEDRKHFYLIDYSKKGEFSPFGITIPTRGLIVLTERGYLLLAKSLTDDKAWEVQERLIDSYFSVKEQRHAVEVTGTVTVKQEPAAIEYKPLNPQQQVGLSKVVRTRAKEAHTTTMKIYRELRDVFEVVSWKEIPADKYTEAKALVKSMVLEGELMQRQTTPVVHQHRQEPPRQEVVVVPLDDWMLIANCLRGLSQAMTAAWEQQGGRSANNCNNPFPRHVQLPYHVASDATQEMGKVYQYTFSALRGAA
jgi:hypothetical protein